MIAIADDSRGTIHNGDVFFRYPGQTKRIRYVELQAIISDAIESSNNQWINLMREIATIGPQNVSLVDMNLGQVLTPNQRLLVDKSLLYSLHFVHEGSFSEVEGAPVLKVTGEVQTIEGVKIVPVKETHYKAIGEDDIAEAFLSSDDPADPLEYIKAACSGRTKLVPFYRFARIAALDARELQQFLVATRGPKSKDLSRRQNAEFGKSDVFVTGSLSSNSLAADRKSYYLEKVTEAGPLQFPDSYEDRRYLLQAITHLEVDDFEPEIVHKLLQQNRIDVLTRFPKLTTDMRRAICHLDLVRYGYSLDG